VGQSLSFVGKKGALEGFIILEGTGEKVILPSARNMRGREKGI